MDQNKTEIKKDELTFADVVLLFRGKIKLLICVTLIVAIIGAALGVVITQMDATYGATITFYVVPKEDSQGLLPLLRSDSFAEKLLLDENGLPPREVCNPEDYDAALKAVQEKNAIRAERYRLYRESIAQPYALAIVEKKYNALSDELTRLSDLLAIYKSAQDENAKHPDHLAKISEYETKLAEVEAELKEYRTEVYAPAVEKKLKIDEEYFQISRSLEDARRNASALVEKVVSGWRNNEDVQSLVEAIQASVSYKYTSIIDDASADKKVENQNTSFLVVTVAVEDDSELAEEIVTKIKDRIPALVEEEVERLTGLARATCTLTSTFVESEKLDQASLTKNVLVFGVIGAILGAVSVFASVIIKNVLPEEMFQKTKKTKKNKKAADGAQ